jgi:AAA family ATP:ADP antiporter
MRYKAKNFIDTVVYRGADMVTSWSYFAVVGLGLTLSQVSAAWLPVAAVYLGACVWLLRMQGTAQPEARPDAERHP